MFALAAVAALATMPMSESPELKIVSYNIRYGTASDGPNSWPYRRDMLISHLQELDADVLGLQEALKSQIDEILLAMPQYGMVGVGRDDGKASGEYAAILYRKSQLKLRESGTFWFSDTPDAPGSKSWGNVVTRICTFALFDLEDKLLAIYNVHLDHESQPSRLKSIDLLLSRIPERVHGVITGDFNVGEDDEVIQRMKTMWRDTFRLAHPNEMVTGTFNGFKNVEDGPKIDYIFVRSDTNVVDAGISKMVRLDRTPSDHFPVWARVKFKPKRTTGQP